MNVRSSGVLLHITSLPSGYGIGDLGPAAYRFARLLRNTGQLYWQFLPLGPTSPAIGNSPYSSPSAFAGNPLFISPELLVQQGVVAWPDIQVADHAPLYDDPARVEYDRVERHRERVLRAAFERNSHTLPSDGFYAEFCRQNNAWLDDYARFVTIKRAHGGAEWRHWPAALRNRDDEALAAWDEDNAREMEYERFVQYLFFRQWDALHAYCRELGVVLVGDVPIYVTYDSADVWANPEYFQLDASMDPVYVAGVPPDYFSETGQRWGNPVYNWQAMRQDGFRWWIDRMRHNFRLADVVRLDHFRGFAGYWQIPAAEKTAVNGRWVDAPGMELFSAFGRAFTSLPIIAEDLGVITADVRELKNTWNLPGMKILQFGFSGDLTRNPDAPFNHERRCVVYTGTHDNAPVRAWFTQEAGDEERFRLGEFVGHSVREEDAHHAFMRLAMAGVADTVVFPLQDVLGLGAESRMNTPSVAEGNWAWRMNADQLEAYHYERFAAMTRFFGRQS
ncbi:4-alpha-glucanotransferase [Oleidesulfovibrio alaskensis G20]|jgi:4-alpha-glucanotransferase|uniref:4-alpha-glucanotransferase n=1 Tax=Oleidesulfovibrio alaskensis (strain ATCC BAA-1058 / DSM 17464 / G20) TaxID=207559 RepID=Q315T5_OLEA2|nr:4-alpha-glucanotransferase [Oleidesulfovibrio alaskensis]ABB37311.1 4-alpha-glucanotransferase [Oleidesulfovibrio alaskensis G20]